MKNADVIRHMTDKQLDEFLAQCGADMRGGDDDEA